MQRRVEIGCRWDPPLAQLAVNLNLGRASRLPLVYGAATTSASALALARSVGRRDACPTLGPARMLQSLAQPEPSGVRPSSGAAAWDRRRASLPSRVPVRWELA